MRPARVSKLYKERFGDGAVVCLGWQVAAVISGIERICSGLEWYVADVEGVGDQTLAAGFTPRRIGVAASLAAHVSLVDQFSRGVFMGVPAVPAVATFRPDGVATDDDEFGDMGDAVVEVRAFDFSYISVACGDETIATALDVLDLRRA